MTLPPGLTQWTAPQGHADIAPSQHERIEYDGYLTIDAPWIVPALLDGVPAIAGRILEPAAGRGHLSLELRRTGLEVVSFDLRRYANRLIERTQDSASPRHNFAWVVWSAAPRIGDPWLRFAGRGAATR